MAKKSTKNLDDHPEKKALAGQKLLAQNQHEKGKLTASERIQLLLDQDSFHEFGEQVMLKSHEFGLQEKKRLGDGVITGFGAIQGRKVCLFAQDFTFMGGSMGEMHNKKIAKVMEFALMTGSPLIGLFDSGGARIQEGIQGLDGGGEIFKLNTLASGVIPQISIILGPCAGIAVYSPALTDFVCMVEKISHMFITGPDVVKTVTGENIDFDALGGSGVHGRKSGVAHLAFSSERECFASVRKLLSYLPNNNLEDPPFFEFGDSPVRKNLSLPSIVPDDPKKSYDMREVIQEIVDRKSFFEIMPEYAQNAIVGFARLQNRVVGLVANQPMILAGCLDINSSDKISRFVRFCDAFSIPLINLVDVTGYLPGTDQEHQGVIRHGAKILYAYSEATVPKIALVLRKAYGGAYIALVSKEMGYDYVLSWPRAEIAVMGAEQAVNIIYRKELAGDRSGKVKAEKIKEYSEKFLNPRIAAGEGKIDKVIDPVDTRMQLIGALDALEGKRIEARKREFKRTKSHGNTPL
ncbi:acyl-CoA carboxylase subunit beta [Candidatus Woesearchaeota archaeon]|nr:acyl-CoA carboxylase subunit beta [Candidatus Woesearchaeota archaeon]